MTATLIFTLILMILLATLLRQPMLLTPVYLLTGAWVIGRWWGRQALKQVVCSRTFVDRAFLNDKLTVKITVRNTGRLPVLWLRLHDSLHSGLGPPVFDRAISLRPFETREFEYVLLANKRGVYHVGPMSFVSGDVFGLGEPRREQYASSPLMVYPRVLSLEQLQLPSRQLLGALRHKQPIHEDPNRARGNRGYVSGDSLRRVDWKATAALGQLQVKQFEPSVSIEAMIALNLSREDYDRMSWIDGTELAIVTAASIANWLIERRQKVGLMINGTVSAAENFQLRGMPVSGLNVGAWLAPHSGRPHMIQLLERLALAQPIEGASFVAQLQRTIAKGNWGTTLIVITGQTNDALIHQLLDAQRRGLSPMLIACGYGAHFEPVQQRCATIGIPAYHVIRERDMRGVMTEK